MTQFPHRRRRASSRPRLCSTLPAAHAQQQGPGWFVPSQPQAQSHPPAARAPRRVRRRRAPPQPSRADRPGRGGAAGDQAGAARRRRSAAAGPDAAGAAEDRRPPAVVVGVLGVPEVMRASTAAQEVEKVIGARREKLNQDAQKEQAAWREMQQPLATERAKLSPDQLRARSASCRSGSPTRSASSATATASSRKRRRMRSGRSSAR